MKVTLSYLRNFIVLIAALQILNLSVCGGEDINTASPQTIGEVNHIDCMVEYVSEIVLRCKNAIAENGMHNTTGNHSLTLKHFLSKTVEQHFAIVIQKFTTPSVNIIPLKDDYFYLFSKEITKPPCV